LLVVEVVVVEVVVVEVVVVEVVVVESLRGQQHLRVALVLVQRGGGRGARQPAQVPGGHLLQGGGTRRQWSAALQRLWQ
jgi:hypothetical protein